MVFETGTNVWRSLTVASEGGEGEDAVLPCGWQAELRSLRVKCRGVDEYVSDPNHPVPFVGYTTDTVPQRYMVDDQRFASYRPDVLVYES